jgi:thiosulfate dehydrogenase [quinone] large subunit
VGGPSYPPPPVTQPFEAPGPSIREQLESASPAAIALLPLRAFFGVTFVYAGVDKLLDPAFFDASNPASIVAQLAAFARVSPLAPLVRIAEPFAIPLGLLIALAEIAIGLGALTGLAFRLAAAGGAALSLLFWLTASWSTHPYYYGPDLPYAFGWITLAIAGHSGLLVPRAVRELGMPHLDDWDRVRAMGPRGGGRPRGGPLEPSPSPEADAARRLILQAGVLGAVTLAVASSSVPVRLFRGSGPSTASTGGLGNGNGAGAGSSPEAGAATPAATPAGTTPAGATPAGTAVPPFTPSGLEVASIAAVDAKGAVRIRVPADAPGSLPAGDPGIIVKLKDGTYVAYDAVCTHEGCRVGWDARDGVMLCPCHGAAFDPNDHGAVLQGPTNTPLPELPIVIDKQAGTISLKA